MKTVLNVAARAARIVAAKLTLKNILHSIANTKFAKIIVAKIVEKEWMYSIVIVSGVMFAFSGFEHAEIIAEILVSALIAAGVMKLTHYLYKLETERGINLPIVLYYQSQNATADDANFKQVVNDINTLTEYKEIHTDMHIYEIDPNDIKLEIQQETSFGYLGRTLSKKELLRRANFHIFPTNLRTHHAVYSGAFFYGFDDISVYQYLDNKHHKVIEFSGREAKDVQRLSYDLINIEKTGGSSKEIALIVDFVSHPVLPEAKEYLESLDETMPFYHIYPNEGKGNIDLKVFKDITIELISAIHNIQNESGATVTHLIIGTPISIAFCIGWYLGNNKDVLLYEYERDGELHYRPFKQLRDIKTIADMTC